MTITLTAWPIRFLEGSAFSETGTALRRVNHVLRFGGGGVANEEAHRQTTNTGVFLRYVQFSPSPPNRCMGASTLYSLAHGTHLVYGDLGVTNCSSRLLS